MKSNVCVCINCKFLNKYRKYFTVSTRFYWRCPDLLCKLQIHRNYRNCLHWRLCLQTCMTCPNVMSTRFFVCVCVCFCSHLYLYVSKYVCRLAMLDDISLYFPLAHVPSCILSFYILFVRLKYFQFKFRMIRSFFYLFFRWGHFFLSDCEVSRRLCSLFSSEFNHFAKFCTQQ